MEEKLSGLFEKYNRCRYRIYNGEIVENVDNENEYDDSSILLLDNFTKCISILPFSCSGLGIIIGYSKKLNKFCVYLGIEGGELTLENFEFRSRLTSGIETYINNSDDLENSIIVIAERSRVAFEKMASIEFEVSLGKRAL